MSKNDRSFFEKVFEVVVQVPEGRVTTYGAIAEYLGSKGSARMVGWAMNSSHSSAEAVPAHRVVNRKGLLTGKHQFETENLMQSLLEAEGITVVENQIQDFERHFWSPILELSD